ncbi:Sodium- and chloride-dependent glycine transporter 2 [Lamellibrachia satsuma]|nr:Sodium- and chloride-dependent glycine transporter 2 [Lamellibrachia satsuma]
MFGFYPYTFTVVLPVHYMFDQLLLTNRARLADEIRANSRGYVILARSERARTKTDNSEDESGRSSLRHCVIDWIMKTATKEKGNGIQWTMLTQLDDLDFADDLALLSHNHRQIQDKTTELALISAQLARQWFAPLRFPLHGANLAAVVRICRTGGDMQSSTCGTSSAAGAAGRKARLTTDGGIRCDTFPSDTVRNLGVIFDSDFNFRQHISQKNYPKCVKEKENTILMSYHTNSVGQHSSLSSHSSPSSSPESEARGFWVGRLDFILSCVGYAVGLGNIWRFPYLCYRNGGAVFLIPYLTFLVLCGMPLFFMEVSYGQFASLSPITVWRLSPFFKGIGYGMVIISAIVCIYYNMIIAWTLHYFFNSFMAVLPWSTCNNEWNTDHCLDAQRRADLNMTNATLSTSALFNSSFKWRTPSEEYWEGGVLRISDGIDRMGSIQLDLFGCLALAWVFVFLCLIKGVQSSGRVVYVTATFPYLVLIILLIRGVTLPGAIDGIKFYVIPKWEKLLDLTVWAEAAMQIFYSIGAAWGALITMSSYNHFHNNCYRDACFVPVLNCITSIFAGFVIFSIIGFMAHETGSAIEDVVTQGPGLVFVVYPQAVAHMPVSQFWSVLFFLMVFTIGLDSQFGMFETMTSAFTDEFPHLFKKRKLLLTAGLCTLEFLLGIPCTMNGGIYFLQIMDWYSSTFSLMILSFTECVVIAWVYGVKRFYEDIELMIGYKPNCWWKQCWCYITPSTILFVFLFTVIQHTPVSYGTYMYPNWAIVVGWLMAVSSMMPLPLFFIIKYYQATGGCYQRILKQVKPSSSWGPALDGHRGLYINSLLKSGSSINELDVVRSLSSKKKKHKDHTTNTMQSGSNDSSWSRHHEHELAASVPSAQALLVADFHNPSPSDRLPDVSV